MAHACPLCPALVPHLPSQVNAFLFTAMKEEKSALWVNWTAPQSELPILQYEVQYRKVRSRASAWVSALRITGSPPQTSTYLKGLFTDTSYLVRVRAASAVGYGNWSSINGSESEFVVCRDVIASTVGILIRLIRCSYMHTKNLYLSIYMTVRPKTCTCNC